MLHSVRIALGGLLFVVTTLMPGQGDARQAVGVLSQNGSAAHDQTHVQTGDGARTVARPFVRTELYFGTAKPNGVVTDEEFRDFLDQHVTPLFPDGLTLLEGDGQFRGEDGRIVKEKSFVLILLYPYETADESARRIERLRTLYKKRFEQESVLRVDDPFIVWVSF